MKYLKFILLFSFPVLMAMQCNKNPLLSPNTPTVKLYTSLNDSTETIHLGDTLKFTLILPDTINAVSKIDGTTSKIFLSTLQDCGYGFTFYKIDTITKVGTRITSIINAFVNPGSFSTGGGSIQTTTGSKPFISRLNIVPPSKGLFYVEFGRQETTLKINNNFNAGIRVNINVVNKHWTKYAHILGYTSTADLEQNDANGYGFYCFWVN